MDSQKIGAAYNALQSGWTRRQDRLKILDKTVEKMACTRFNQLMWKKGHMGSLKLLRKERRLEIKVTIKGDNAGGVEKDLKSLSGESSWLQLLTQVSHPWSSLHTMRFGRYYKSPGQAHAQVLPQFMVLHFTSLGLLPGSSGYVGPAIRKVPYFTGCRHSHESFASCLMIPSLPVCPCLLVVAATAAATGKSAECTCDTWL